MKTFAPSGCGVGQVIRNMNADGTFECASITCSGSDVFRGLDGSGNPICVSAGGSLDCISVSASSGGTTASVSCPAGYELSGGGLRDTDFADDHVYWAPNMGTNTYNCYSSDSGGALTCHAICCRVN